MKKRMIALLVCLVLILGVLPFGAFADTTIQKIAVSGYKPPVIGRTTEEMAFTTTIPDNAPYYVTGGFWFCDTTSHTMESTDVFEEGKSYSYSWTVYAKDGYVFDENTAVTINGGTEYVDLHYTGPADESGEEFYVWTVSSPALEGEEITTVSVYGNPVPYIGQTAGASLASFSVPDYAPYTISVLFWYNGTDDLQMKNNDVFEEGKSYFIHFEVKPKESYTFGENAPKVYINDGAKYVDKEWTTVKSNGSVLFYTIDLTPVPLIKVIKLYGVTIPKAGQTAGANLETVTPASDADYTISYLSWFNGTDDHIMSNEEVFEESKSYFICFRVTPNEGYAFSESDLTVYINGGTELVDTQWTAVAYNGDVLFYTADIALAAPITQIEVNGFVSPKVGQTAGENLASLTLPDGAPYTFQDLYWYNGTDDHDMSADEVFEAGKTYYIHFDVWPTEGNAFAGTAGTILINGSVELVDEIWTSWKTGKVMFFTVDIELASSVLYGDVNGDGTVNKKDSLALKKYLADPGNNPIDLAAADVTADGAVNKKDSLRLKQYLAGWDVALGA